jgi:Flp pilus assembly protein TadD
VIPTRKHLDYALGYIELGLFAEAREELSRITTADRKQPSVLGVLLELAMAEEAWTAVITFAPQIAEADPSNERPWIAWAYALRERGKITEARDVLLRGAAAISEPSVLVDYNLACYFCLLGDLTEARRRLNLVFARDPHWKTDARQDPDLAALHTKATKPD